MHFEVTNPKSSHSFGVYEALTADDAVKACCVDAGYESTEHAESVMGHASELTAHEVARPIDEDNPPTIEWQPNEFDEATHSIEDGHVRYWFEWPAGAPAQWVADQFLSNYESGSSDDALSCSIETVDGAHVAVFTGEPNGNATLT